MKTIIYKNSCVLSYPSVFFVWILFIDQDGFPDDQASLEWDWDSTHWDHKAWEQHSWVTRYVCGHGHAGGEPGNIFMNMYI